MDNMSIETMYDILVNYEIATEEEVNLVTTINGYNIETLQDILEVRTGYKNMIDWLFDNTFIL